MPSRLKSIVQYVIMISLTASLLWLSLRGITVGEGENKSRFLWETWLKSDKIYLLLMAGIFMLSNVLRAERWKMLLAATKNNVSLSSTFLSVMIAYLVNLAVPRGGEVSRCYNLFKLERTPVEISFGTVVVERIVDVLCLLLVILISFLVEWDKLITFINTLPFSKNGGGKIPVWIVIVGLFGMVLFGLVYFFRKNEKLRKILRGFKEGLMAVFRLDHKPLFIFYSLLIWALYFLMSYFVVKAFPETNPLGFGAVLTLFALGSIAMAAPLPGGAGSYHTIVPLGLVMLYHLPQADAIAFVFIFHAWQTLIMIVSGVVSLIISYWLIRWKGRQTK